MALAQDYLRPDMQSLGLIMRAMEDPKVEDATFKASMTLPMIVFPSINRSEEKKREKAKRRSFLSVFCGGGCEAKAAAIGARQALIDQEQEKRLVTAAQVHNNKEDLEEYKKLPRFLYGESMGGAVALLVHRKEPMNWNGAVLVAPMCKIAKESKTHPLMESFLIKLCSAFPTWKIVPTKDVTEAAFKDPNKRQEESYKC